MKVLVATEKPFAKAAVDGIKSIVEAAGGEVVLLEKYTEVEQFYAAVAEVDAGFKFENGVKGNVYSAHTDALINQLIQQKMEEKQILFLAIM